MKKETKKDQVNINFPAHSRRSFIRSSFGFGVVALSSGSIGHLFGSESTAIVSKNAKRESSKALGRRYYAHQAVLDEYGVVAPWYSKLNGQCDFRIRIAAETLKRYPWRTLDNAVAEYPDYLFTSVWAISETGDITSPQPTDWQNGDLGQRSTSVLTGMVNYYRYSGDPAAIAHMKYMADFLLDHSLTPADHSWPSFPISVPVKGKSFGEADPDGMIQLDISAGMGTALLKAYQVTNEKRWFEAAKHWGDLFAEKCNMDSNGQPWNRYAGTEYKKYWRENPLGNVQTGGVTMILGFLDELIRLGYTGKNGQILRAREAGLRYLRDVLLPKWTIDSTFAHFFWDWINQTQNCSTTSDVANYILNNKPLFPNWRTDVRNILTLFLNRTGVDIASSGDLYNGAWAYPESSSCCKQSLWYAPLMVGSIMARYAADAGDEWMREIAYRQFILQTYDVLENGNTEDLLDGGVLVNNIWLNIAHPWPLLWVNNAIAWLPEALGASRENHIVNSTSVINHVNYGKGVVSYQVFDAPEQTVTKLRLSFKPIRVIADGQTLTDSSNLNGNGFKTTQLPNGDCLIEVRHDGKSAISISGSDKQAVALNKAFAYEGDWKKADDKQALSGNTRIAGNNGASATLRFRGNQVRLVARVDEFGGKADVYIDGQKQFVGIDYWNPSTRNQQIVYYKNGLDDGEHVLKIVAQGAKNPYAKGTSIYIDSLQSSTENTPHNFPVGTGPTSAQRMIFGYTNREDYRDGNGNLWKPATEIISRNGFLVDVVKASWWTIPSGDIRNTRDPECYRYGYHAPEFWVNLTVGPGKYDARLGFASTRGAESARIDFDVFVNGKKLMTGFNPHRAAGGDDTAIDLIIKGIVPNEGAIVIRFQSTSFPNPSDPTEVGDAFVQCLELDREIKSDTKLVYQY